MELSSLLCIYYVRNQHGVNTYNQKAPTTSRLLSKIAYPSAVKRIQNYVSVDLTSANRFSAVTVVGFRNGFII